MNTESLEAERVKDPREVRMNKSFVRVRFPKEYASRCGEILGSTYADLRAVLLEASEKYQK